MWNKARNGRAETKVKLWDSKKQNVEKMCETKKAHYRYNEISVSSEWVGWQRGIFVISNSKAKQKS